ncbi:MAG TPA: porin [Moraxellaceae bacterium]|nr:porin [Moraxellaceae bacterium]
MFCRTMIALACTLATSTTLANDGLEELRVELARQKALIETQQQQLDSLASTVEAAPTGKNDEATTVGFYGEMHYNQRDEEDPAIGSNNIHLHRFVIFLGHTFSDTLSFKGELEFEGAPDETEIETEVEQAYIDWKLNDAVSLNIGQFLVPVGLLNETHEPDVIYGVERNPVEEFIIPATWWEKGVMARWQAAPGLALDAAIHNGLNGQGAGGIAALGTPDGLREFRQEFGGARAEDLAYTVRLKYTGISGLELGTTLQKQDNIVQSSDPLFGGEAPATLMEAHADWHWHKLGLRALAARWDIDNELARTNGTDLQKGIYIEPSYRLNETVGLFARYNHWNTAANATGVEDSEQVNAGVNWWINPRVVLKADLQDTNQADGAGDGFNLGMGLSF